jgi:hypothetical protein
MPMWFTFVGEEMQKCFPVYINRSHLSRERLNSRTRNLQTFQPTVSPDPESPDIFLDTSGNPENRGKCPDCLAYKEEIKSTEIKFAQT